MNKIKNKIFNLIKKTIENKNLSFYIKNLADN